jgi:hypothetical protein
VFDMGNSKGQQASERTSYHACSDEQRYTLGNLRLPVPDGKIPANGEKV